MIRLGFKEGVAMIVRKPKLKAAVTAASILSLAITPFSPAAQSRLPDDPPALSQSAIGSGTTLLAGSDFVASDTHAPNRLAETIRASVNSNQKRIALPVSSEYLVEQDRLLPHAAVLRDRLKASSGYGGMWFRNVGDMPQLTVGWVATASGAEQTALELVPGSKVLFVPVEFALSTLNSARTEILNTLVQKSIGTSAVGISIDEPLNRLSLIPSPTNTTSTTKTLSAGLVLSSGVSVVVEPPQTVVAEYSGGQNLPGTGGCTLGFSIQRYGQESSITAEHCLDSAVLDGYAAPVSVQYNFGAYHFQVNTVGCCVTGQPFASSIPVSGYNWVPVNTFFYKSGNCSGDVGGTIVDNDFAVTYLGVAHTGHLRGTALHCEGDSGGPWITPSGLAIGLHSGGFIGGDSFGSKIGSALQSEGSSVKCLKISGGGCYY